jgi:Flp pilus assembly protein TadD
LGYARAGGADSIAGLVDDPSPAVAEMAALALAALGDSRAEAALKHLATNPATTSLPQPHLILGRMALQRANYDEAVRELEQSVDLMPYVSDALVSLGGAYLRSNRFDLARENATLALHFAPHHEGAERLLGMIGQR